VGDAFESPEKSEKYIERLVTGIIDGLTEAGDIPEKFYLSGHSAGGHQCMMYAGMHPERVEGLFLQSPPAEDW
jgi:pimeloyl-ACP methyl ester carboxylesterase